LCAASGVVAGAAVRVGLLTATLHNLEHQNFGFDQDRRTIVSIDPALAGYKQAQLESLYRRIHDAMASIPGVSSAAICAYSPQGGDSWNDSIFVDWPARSRAQG
jgi:hypothetical protein